MAAVLRMKLLILFVGFVLVTGCAASNDGAGGDGYSVGYASPADKCDDLITTLCGRGADCVAQVGCDPGYTREQEYQLCLTESRQRLACGKALGVGPSYSACMNAASTRVCAAYGTRTQCASPALPADCQGVILF